MTMLALYIFCVTFGAVLLGTSIFLGGGDADADVDADADMDMDMDADMDMDMDMDADMDMDMDMDADMDADVDADMDGHLDLDHGVDVHGDIDAHSGSGWEWSVLPFGSLRFWTFLVEAFGLTGALLTLIGVPSGITLTISLMTGSVLGYLAFMFFRHLTKETVTADIGLKQYVSSEAKVVVTVRPKSVIGKIVVETMAGRVEIPANTRDKEPIRPGSIVLIANVDNNGVAHVTQLSPGASSSLQREEPGVARRQMLEQNKGKQRE
ncbi:MAG: hypothetical protein HN348_21880 [Proteobacteria bacterium]|jgi:hypothetical protein|nr:hypothetical protein [Pseudomonadota bacterium]